jgi:hypothetical protein
MASIAILIAAGAPQAEWIDWAIGALAVLTLVTVSRRIAAAVRLGP